ncbi:MAG: GDSL-type esterase/lipase family protein [Sulfurimonas sp.]|nr:GDSL-type esterase/lipase family protein [Sulfurimonas sp.]
MNKILFSTILVFILIIYLTNTKEKFHYSPLKSDAVILAYGDSLTYGFGVKKEFSYPSVLAKKSGLKVINAGVSGEVSIEGLKRLSKFLEKNPDLVILCHGGNDILKKYSKEQLKNNLIAMINLIKQSGAEVLLVGVVNLSFTEIKVLALYDEIAQETGVMYENKILPIVMQGRAYKSDYIHPNKIGYEMMADAFIEILEEYKVLNNTKLF